MGVNGIISQGSNTNNTLNLDKGNKLNISRTSFFFIQNIATHGLDLGLLGGVISVIYGNLTPLYLNRSIQLFYSLSLFIGGAVSAFSVLFGLPSRGQRSWSNGSTANNRLPRVFNYKYLKFRQLFRGRRITTDLFLAEYVSLYWQQQWFKEWVSGYSNLQALPFFINKGNFIDIESIVSFRIHHYYHTPFNNGSVLSGFRVGGANNSFTAGLPFGFSFIFNSQLDRV